MSDFYHEPIPLDPELKKIVAEQGFDDAEKNLCWSLGFPEYSGSSMEDKITHIQLTRSGEEIECSGVQIFVPHLCVSSAYETPNHLFDNPSQEEITKYFKRGKQDTHIYIRFSSPENRLVDVDTLKTEEYMAETVFRLRQAGYKVDGHSKFGKVHSTQKIDAQNLPCILKEINQATRHSGLEFKTAADLEAIEVEHRTKWEEIASIYPGSELKVCMSNRAKYGSGPVHIVISTDKPSVGYTLPHESLGFKGYKPNLEVKTQDPDLVESCAAEISVDIKKVNAILNGLFDNAGKPVTHLDPQDVIDTLTKFDSFLKAVELPHVKERRVWRGNQVISRDYKPKLSSQAELTQILKKFDAAFKQVYSE